MITKTFAFETPSLHAPKIKAATQITVALKGSENGKDYVDYKDDFYRLSIRGRYNDGLMEQVGYIEQVFFELQVPEEEKKLQQDILTLWKEHLNDIHAGTREQEQIIHENLPEYDYTKACEILKANEMYEVVVNGRPYKYGHGWLYYKLSDNAISLLKKYRLILD